MSAVDRKPITIKQALILLCVAALVGAVIVSVAWSMHPEFAYWMALFTDGFAYLESNPWALILCLLFLPGIGFPVSPLLILTGIVFGERFGIVNACIIGVCTQTFCSTWTYALAAGPLRGFLLRTILRDRPIPDLTRRNAWRLGVLLRITPGIPYAMQNIVLGVVKLPFLVYLTVSIPIQSLYAIGFMVSGGAIFQGEIGLAITAFAFLIVIILVARIYQSRKRAYVG